MQKVEKTTHKMEGGREGGRAWWRVREYTGDRSPAARSECSKFEKQGRDTTHTVCQLRGNVNLDQDTPPEETM